ncbi:MAG: hypothetical protein IPJ06_03935 [Saprospiraceae bacterium]|nr:hypothetical protein [Saprospiraceae bacterium]
MSSNRIRLSEFPSTFWSVNTMEIFERMAWYGFFAVSSLYITGAVGDGGLGFSDEDRGVLQGVVTFFLYLFLSLPVPQQTAMATNACCLPPF